MEYRFSEQKSPRNILIITIIGIIAAIFLGVTTAINYKISFGLIAIPAVIFFVFIRPKIFFYFIAVFVIMFPKINVITVPGTYIGIRGEDFLIFLGLIYFGLSIILQKKTTFHVDLETKKIIRMAILYFGACLLSTLYGYLMGYISNPMLAIMFLFRKIEYFCLFFVGYNLIKSDRDNKKLIMLIDVCLILLIIIGLLQSVGVLGAFSLGQYDESVAGRITSTFSGPWEYSAFLVLISPIYLYRIFGNKQKNSSKFIAILALVLIYYSLFLTQARIAILAFTIVLLYLILRSKNALIVLMLCLIMLLFPIILSNITLPERFETLNLASMYENTRIAFVYSDYKHFLEYGYSFYSSSDDLSFSLRISKWADLLNGFVHNPILGLGLSTTTEAVDGNYVRYIAESGLVGITIWFLLIRKVLKSSRKAEKHSNKNLQMLGKTLRYGTIGLLVVASFIDIFEASKIAMFYWLLVGVLFRSMANHKETNKI